MAYLPKRQLSVSINFRELHITKPESLNGISIQEGLRYRSVNDTTSMIFEYDNKIVMYDIIGIQHTHQMNVVLNRWGEMGVEGIIIDKI